MQLLKNIKNIKSKVVIVRADFNVPIINGKITDDFRIKKALPTINFLRKAGAKIILISHIGESGESLLPVAKYLAKIMPIHFSGEVIGPKTTTLVKNLKNSEIVLLENLRMDPGEEKNDGIFAMNLACLAGIYVNEAFPVCHRHHASIVALPKLLPCYAGFTLVEEIKHLSVALRKTPHPFLFILGGAKFSTKIPLLEKFLKKVDKIYIGGAIANNFLKEKGFNIKKSTFDKNSTVPKNILASKKIILPIDFVWKDNSIKDIGAKSAKELLVSIKKSKFVLWNGPLGFYEQGFDKSTKLVLKTLSESKAKTIIGGGDTVDLVSKLKLEKKFFFVSSGGGAALEFLATGTLPGIKALE